MTAAVGTSIWLLLSLQCILIVTACNHDGHSEVRHARSERSDNVFAYGRLPRSLRPIHYEVELQPNGLNLSFIGKVKIRFRVQSRTSNITLHSADLSLHQLKLLSRNEGVLAPRVFSSTLEPMNQFLVIKLDSELQEGREFELHIDYRGLIYNDPTGIFKVNYKDDKGNNRWLLTTQLEPDSARRVFPSFDEPEWKTTFNLTLVRPRALTTISNMRRIASITRDGDWMEDIFESTVKMSTYLLAFVIGNYTFAEDGTTSNTVVRAWTRPEFISQTSYALLKAPQIVNFFEGFFNVSYPLPKLDLMAIPGMEFGGMENWGIINFDDSIVHYNEKTASLGYKTNFLNFLIHEIAHQWFGNLVTMKWWDDIWLNEGFATYMEVVAGDAVESTWRLSDLFTVETLMPIMEQDSVNGTDSVFAQNVDIRNLGEVFQYMIYYKGASLIRMMDHFLSRDILQKGLANYLDTMQYNSVTQDDLWRFLTEAAKNCTVLNDTDVKTVMDTWTKQSGYPVVTVFRDYTEQTATLTQKRFFYNKQMKDTTSRWNIPITFTTAAEKNFNQTLPRKWFNITDTDIMLNQTDGLPSAEDWLILNLQQGGYYRVNYDPFNWNLLIQQLKSNHMQIHATNRAQILNDILNLARAGIVNYNLALSATKYLKDEMEYVPWKAAILSFDYLDSMLSLTSLYGRWKTYVQRLIEPAYKAIGFEDRLNDSYLKRMTRSLLVEQACKIGLPSCIQIAQKIYRQWMESNGTSLIAPNLAEAVICTGIKYGGEAEWDFAWRQLVSSVDTALRNTLIKGMTCSREPWILLRYLTATIYGNETFYSEQKRTVLQEIGHHNSVGRYLAFEFLTKNWDKYKEFLTLGMTMGDAIRDITYNMNTQDKLELVKGFMKSHEGALGVATRPFNIAIDTIGTNIRWVKDNMPTISQWLRKNV